MTHKTGTAPPYCGEMPKGKHLPPRKPARKLSPDSPEARDEGPRLIPLDLKTADHTWGQYALELADVALGHKTKSRHSRVLRGNA
jgi:hypothetical protein